MKKYINRFIKITSGFLLITVLLLFIAIIYFNSKIPDKFYLVEGDEFQLTNLDFIVKDDILDYNKTSLANNSLGSTQVVDLKLFGIIPVAQTQVNVISEQEVTPGGNAFGIKLFTKGVLVIDVNDIQTDSGLKSPAKSAGIQTGDIILSIDNIEVTSNEQIAQIIMDCNGQGLNVEYQRNNITTNTYLLPVVSIADGSFKSGIWVRDSSAGIGTITYYNKATGVFGGLGHGICDSDTGLIMPLSSGEVCDVVINGYKKGVAGNAGELQGSFTSNTSSGDILINNECGVFGILDQNPNDFDSVPIRLKQDIQLGEAHILSTLSDGEPVSYSINIDKIDLNSSSLTKNISITITDPALLSTTGGIVQGMSGSPIIQQNEIVGAVTHVFVNNPTKGYAIFIENMLSIGDLVA